MMKGIIKEVNEFEMIYIQFKNKNERKAKIEELENKGFFLEDKREYTDDLLRIFGKKFVYINKNKCKIVYKDKEYKLKEYLEDIDNDYKNNDIIKLKLKGIQDISNMSYTFYRCFQLYLLSIPDDIQKSTQLCTFESVDIFRDCKLPLYQNIETKTNKTNIKDNTDIYKEYSIQKSSIPKKTTKFIEGNYPSYFPIFSYKFNEITDLSGMFYGCISLISIPDISNFDISNVTNISGMFCLCSSLTSLPDISKWNTSNIENISFMFYDCKSLISLPDISKWDTSKVNNMSYMFSKCNSLISLPDISKWNTYNVTDISRIFSECLYQIYQNGIHLLLLIYMECFMNVNH